MFSLHPIFLVAVVLLFSTAGCTQKKRWLQCVPKSQDPRIQVFYTQNRDLMQGNTHAVRYTLRLVNSTDSDLADVWLTINNAWSAELGQLILYRGFWEGTDVIGESRLKVGETTELIFSHDISNHCLFTNNTGKSMPVTTHFGTLRLDYDGGSEILSFTNGMKQEVLGSLHNTL